MKLIPLTGKYGIGKYAKVDKAGYVKAMRTTKCWSLQQGYVRGTDPETKKEVYLHRFLLGSPKGIIDHIDGDPLNNKISNLRVISSSMNARNKKIKTPKCLGVSYNKRSGKWRSRFKIDGKSTFLGWFEEKDDARRAYKKAVLALDPLLAIRYKNEWADL